MGNLKRRLFYIFCTAVLLLTLAPQPAFAADDYDGDFRSSNDFRNFYDPRAKSSTCTDDAGPGGDFDASGGSDVPKDWSLGNDKGKRTVNLAKQMMSDFKLTDFQAAGVIGNFMQESGGSHLPPDYNEGGRRGPPRFSGGYGWAQWTGGRQVTFIDFAIKQDFMKSKSVNANDAANYAYLKYEITKTAEKKVIPALAKAKNVEDAVLTWEKVFERAGIPNNTQRIKYAKSVLKAMKSGGSVAVDGGGGSSDDASDGESEECEQSAGQATAGSVFENVVFPLRVAKKDIRNPEIFKNGTTSQGGHPYIAFDIYAAAGTTVLAFTDGVVTARHSGSMGGGLSIYNEKKKLQVYYTHMNPDSSVKVGDKITPGDKLGTLVSVKQYPSINTDHLHIDAGEGRVRQGCSRSTYPNGASCENRVSIGADLFKAWEKVGVTKPGDNTDAPKAV